MRSAHVVAPAPQIITPATFWPAASSGAYVPPMLPPKITMRRGSTSSRRRSCSNASR